MDLMAPVFNQALKAGHVGFVADTYMYKRQSIVLQTFWVFCSTMVYATKGAPSECQQHWPEYGEEIYSNTLFNRLWHYQCADVLVPRKGYSYQTDREPLPH